MSVHDERHEGRLVFVERMHSCPDCSHGMFSTKVTLEFEVKAPLFEDIPSSHELVTQLEDVLPREWTSAGHGADWWVSNIDSE